MADVKMAMLEGSGDDGLLSFGRRPLGHRRDRGVRRVIGRFGRLFVASESGLGRRQLIAHFGEFARVRFSQLFDRQLQYIPRQRFSVEDNKQFINESIK